MKNKAPIDKAGTPQVNSLFAVFPDSEAYYRAERELTALGIQPEQLRKKDAAALDSPNSEAGMVGAIGRFLKGIGGETNMAKNYVRHLRNDRVVLGCYVADEKTAEKVTRIITKHGGYEVAYFRPLGIQYMSPRENAERGISTHAGTNTDT
jgi:hypothetical protein